MSCSFRYPHGPQLSQPCSPSVATKRVRVGQLHILPWAMPHSLPARESDDAKRFKSCCNLYYSLND